MHLKNSYHVMSSIENPFPVQVNGEPEMIASSSNLPITLTIFRTKDDDGATDATENTTMVGKRYGQQGMYQVNVYNAAASELTVTIINLGGVTATTEYPIYSYTVPAGAGDSRTVVGLFAATVGVKFNFSVPNDNSRFDLWSL